mmetsp:Transcript_23777/g.54081  ORF Transcript_23777/g.54081 Transcript_23777/m.54081 type:complete len:206 (+) Transcript_23777:534-1151(+)
MMSVAIIPGEQAFTLMLGRSRASTIVYELRRALLSPYTPIELPSPFGLRSAAPLGYASTSSSTLQIPPQVTLASVKKDCRSAAQRETQPDAAPDDICTMRPLVASSSGRKASSTRFGPLTLMLRISATVPEAIPALFTMAYRGGGLRPSSASILAAAALTLPSEDVSISSTVIRPAHSGCAAVSSAVACSPRAALRHARITCVSA